MSLWIFDDSVFSELPKELAKLVRSPDSRSATSAAQVLIKMLKQNAELEKSNVKKPMTPKEEAAQEQKMKTWREKMCATIERDVQERVEKRLAEIAERDELAAQQRQAEMN
jgi:precorrin-2 methylase